MSVQTILHNSLDHLCEEAVKNTITNADKLVLYDRFMLGKGYCEKDQFHNTMIKKMIRTNDRELVCYLNEVIEKGVEHCEK